MSNFCNRVFKIAFCLQVGWGFLGDVLIFIGGGGRFVHFLTQTSTKCVFI